MHIYIYVYIYKYIYLCIHYSFTQSLPISYIHTYIIYTHYIYVIHMYTLEEQHQQNQLRVNQRTLCLSYSALVCSAVCISWLSLATT